jgi:hypothetical protein
MRGRYAVRILNVTQCCYPFVDEGGRSLESQSTEPRARSCRPLGFRRDCRSRARRGRMAAVRDFIRVDKLGLGLG